MQQYSDESEMPEDSLEQALSLQNIMIAQATGRGEYGDDLRYKSLRRSLIQKRTLANYLPQNVYENAGQG